jgi:hypothetical protein
MEGQTSPLKYRNLTLNRETPHLRERLAVLNFSESHRFPSPAEPALSAVEGEG